MEIIDSLIDLGDITFRWAQNPYEFSREMHGRISSDEWDRIFCDQRRKRALKRLRDKKWIADRRSGTNIQFTLRYDAAVKSIQSKIQTKTTRLPSRTFALVTFDFPEAARRARDAFRLMLKHLSFRQQQLSVWISDKNVVHELELLVRMMKLDKWVRVYRARMA
jgi:DNA-binding transcriptional regulator PaaX